MRGSAMGVLAAVLVAFCMAGCGRKSAQHPPKPVAQSVGVPLPEWAPKNPSPEFLRAARVLKPIPQELLRGLAGQSAEGKVLLERAQASFPAIYEFFGTLTDEQVGQFQSSKEIRIPAKSLVTAQRAALDKWFDAWRQAMKGAQPEFQDYLILLYKMGAKEDLSNVDVGFTAKTAGGGHIVHIYFWVRMTDGKVNDFGTAFAQI